MVENVGHLLENYRAQDRSGNEVAQTLDAARFEAWRERAANGEYQRPLVHVYFIWDPQLHHKVTGKLNKRRVLGFTGKFSARAAIERSRQEHEELVAEFESLLVGMEATMQAAELGPRRLTDQELFLEARRALNPLEPDTRQYIPGEDFIEYRSARQQMANVSIAGETDTYLNINGVLYSVALIGPRPFKIQTRHKFARNGFHAAATIRHGLDLETQSMTEQVSWKMRGERLRRDPEQRQRLFFPQELRFYLEAAGFAAVKLMDGYRRTTRDFSGRRLIAVAEKGKV